MQLLKLERYCQHECWHWCWHGYGNRMAWPERLMSWTSLDKSEKSEGGMMWVSGQETVVLAGVGWSCLVMTIHHHECLASNLFHTHFEHTFCLYGEDFEPHLEWDSHCYEWPSPFSLSLFSTPLFPLFLDPYRTVTGTSMLSPSTPTSSDLLYDSFYESFLFLAYDSFGLIAWVTPIFRHDSLWLILWVILIFRPLDPLMTHSMSHLYT